MSELPNAWESDEQFWEYVKDNKNLIGIPLTEEQGLDILSALRELYYAIPESPEGAQEMLTLMAITLLASSLGNGDIVINEVMVRAAMEEFDESIGKILDEESK